MIPGFGAGQLEGWGSRPLRWGQLWDGQRDPGGKSKSSDLEMPIDHHMEMYISCFG